MPAPYPRACVCCAKSKKRCDLRVPCSRCQLRSLDCQYQYEHDLAGQQVSAPLPEIGSNLPTIHVDPRKGDIADRTMDRINGDIIPLQMDFDQNWPEIMSSIEDFIVPDQIGLDNSLERSVLAGNIYQERIVYSVKMLQSYPSLFVREGSTPFIHQSLYREDMPPAIQDALGTSALYSAENETNQGLVSNVIKQKVTNLIESYDRSEISGFEELATLQALVLYQIIRLFDGNIRLRADAERDESVLVDWARQVQLRIKQAGAKASNELLSTLSSVADPWRKWLFAESQRRTVIVCFALQGLYCFLRNGWDNSHHDFEELSFFAQKALWAAPSAYHWRSAVEKHRLLPVRFPTWDSDMACSEPSDMEELGMMMMVLIKGVDYCAEWVGEQYIDTYGLSLHVGGTK